jgi:D-tyrosyl-tRNA(Tyr) deacylase
MMSVDAARTDLGLLDWSTLVEASHWSGSTSGSHLELVSRFPVPVFDVEIGSTSSSWSDPRAALALARGLLHVPCWIEQPVFSLLCVGGVHFETAFRDALFTSRSPAFAVSHILPSRWVQIDGYQGANGVERFRKCVNTILGGVRAIVFHDSLRADQKSCLRDLGKELDIPVVKHRHLRNGQL